MDVFSHLDPPFLVAALTSSLTFKSLEEPHRRLSLQPPARQNRHKNTLATSIVFHLLSCLRADYDICHDYDAIADRLDNRFGPLINAMLKPVALDSDEIADMKRLASNEHRRQRRAEKISMSCADQASSRRVGTWVASPPRP